MRSTKRRVKGWNFSDHERTGVRHEAGTRDTTEIGAALYATILISFLMERRGVLCDEFRFAIMFPNPAWR